MHFPNDLWTQFVAICFAVAAVVQSVYRHIDCFISLPLNFFVDFGNYPLLWSMIDKDFLPFSVLLFAVVIALYFVEKLYNFTRSCLLTFRDHPCMIEALFRKFLLTSICWRIFLKILYRNFSVADYQLSSLLPLDLGILEAERDTSSFILLQISTLVFQHNLVNRLSLFQSMFLSPLYKVRWIYLFGLFLGPVFWFICLYVFFMPEPGYLL